MEAKHVKDVMVPLDDYAVVDSNATVFEALMALRESQTRLKPGQYLHRAVLVKNGDGAIVGKLGHLSFLKALEPKYNEIGDLPSLARAGLTPEFISSLAVKWDIFKEDLGEACKRLKEVRVVDAMHPVKEHIDENAPMSEAIHKIVMWQTLSILVISGGKAVGLLRLGDLFNEVFGELVCNCV
jgi:hypothetical protein